MYKHFCVECLLKHGYKCMWSISFFDRFFGTNKVIYCPEYIRIMEYQNKFKNRGKGKK
jgi:hypothetical protein